MLLIKPFEFFKIKDICIGIVEHRRDKLKKGDNLQFQRRPFTVEFPDKILRRPLYKLLYWYGQLVGHQPLVV